MNIWEVILFLRYHLCMTDELYLTFLTGIFITAALFYMVLFFGFSRKAAFLFFALFCVSYAGKIVFSATLDFMDFGLTGEVENTAKGIAYYLGGVALIGFLLYEFEVPRRPAYLLAFVIITWIPYWLHWIPYAVAFMPVALAITAYAHYQRKEGSTLALVGLFGLALFNYLDHEQNLIFLGFFIGVLFFIVCMTLSVGRQVAQQFRLRQEAHTRSERLENQLLKKSIQPHFIFNSLASLQELIDQQPMKASQFVDSLAEEFRMLNAVVGKSLIPIQEELSLCQAHLSIMEFRKNARFRFEVEGVQGDEWVPPAIFHTLIENGITHGYGLKREGFFHLKKTNLTNGASYRLFNDSELERVESVSEGNGTGYKYLEARLQENYGDHWAIDKGAVERGWEVTISIFNTKR